MKTKTRQIINQKLPRKPKLFFHMSKLFICGSNFQLEDLEDELPKSASAGSSPCSTPRRSRKASNRDKNPYASRGLDKFSALLADLEEKRQKIYAETGSQDISLVRFVYKNSDDLVPIVVKLKDKNNNNNINNNKKEKKTKRSATMNNNEEVKENKQTTNNTSESQDKFPIETSIAVKEVKKPESNNKKIVNRSFSWNMKLDTWKKPAYYLPVVMILILLLLTLFGRSVAILCTSISWYVVPTLQDSSSRKRLPTKKKDYVKKLSDRRMVSEGSPPRISHTGGSKDKSSSPQHGQQKSW